MTTASFVGRLTLAFISLAVTGCGSQGPTPGVPAMLQQTHHLSAATSAPLIYVANTHVKGGRWHHASLLGFASDANGNVPPVFEIRGNATDMARWGATSTSVAIDKSGRLYGIGEDECAIGVWPAGSNGDVHFATQFAVNCNDFGGPPISFVLDGKGDTWASSYVGDYADGARTNFTSTHRFPRMRQVILRHRLFVQSADPKRAFTTSCQSRSTAKAKCRFRTITTIRRTKAGSSRLQRLQTVMLRPSQG